MTLVEKKGNGFKKIQRRCWLRRKEVVSKKSGDDVGREERKCFHHNKKESGCITMSVDNGAVSVECSAMSCKEKPKVDETSDDGENCLKFQTILIVVKHDSNVI